MKRMLLAVALATFTAGAFAADAPQAALPVTKSPAGAEVYIVSPKDGAIVGPEVTVVFGLKGMGVAPAGTKKEGTGHHHLLVDVKDLPAAGQPIAKDEQHLHFGNGQTETTLKLAPGKHTLQLELADENHIPFDPPVLSKPVTVNVK